MRTINPTTRYKRDYKRELKGLLRLTLDKALDPVILLLAHDVPLPPSLRDHPLSGEYQGSRDCHVKPDLILIYRNPMPKRWNSCASAATANWISDPCP